MTTEAVLELERLHKIVSDHCISGKLDHCDMLLAEHELTHLACSSHRFDTTSAKPKHYCKNCFKCEEAVRSRYLRHLKIHMRSERDYNQSRWWRYENL